MRPLPVILASLALGTAAAFLAPRPSAESAPAAVAIAHNSSPPLETLNALQLSPALARELRLAQLAATRNASDATAWVRLGDALTQHARDTLDVSLYAEIEKLYRHAHRLDPNDPSALVGLAWSTGARHRFEDSVAWATLALKQDPELAVAHGLLGDAAVELGNYAEASRHYQRMLDLKPDMGSYSRAAHLLYLQGNVARATALMRQAIRAGGSSPEHTAWCVAELSSMFCREGATLPARQLAEDALQRAPRNPTLLAAVGQARMAAGDDAGAIAAYEQSVLASPQHASLVALHDLYLAQNRRDLAEQTARRIRELHAQLQVQGVRGTEGQFARFLADRGENPGEAVELALTEYGHHHTAFAADTLAWALHRAGRTAEALPVLRDALKRRAPDAAILYHAGIIEEAAGNFTDARRHLNAAVSRQPRFNPAHAPLAYAAIARLGSIAAADLAQLSTAAQP